MKPNHLFNTLLLMLIFTSIVKPMELGTGDLPSSPIIFVEFFKKTSYN